MKFKIWHIFLFVGVLAVIAVDAMVLYWIQNNPSSGGQNGDGTNKTAEIQLTIISAPDCKECFDVTEIIKPLKENEDKVKITKEKTYEYNSWRGKRIVEKYGIVHAPAILVQGDTEAIFDPVSFRQNLGIVAEDGTYVVTQIPAPYLEIATSQIKGKFTVTYLTDKSCAECYDPILHRSAMETLMMKPAEEIFIDRADEKGQELIDRYKIQSTPTILLQGEFDLYPQLQQVWPSVGTIEEDGTYVFREAGQKSMGTYFDIKVGKMVKSDLPE